MTEPVILSEKTYVDPRRAASDDGSDITFIRTACFLPRQLTDGSPLPFTPDHLRQAESYVVLTSLQRPWAPPLAGFVTWKPLPPNDPASPYVHKDQAGDPQWRLGYGYVPFNNPKPDDELLRETGKLAAPVLEQTEPRLLPLLARRLQADLRLASDFDGDLGASLAKAYGNHIARILREQR